MNCIKNVFVKFLSIYRFHKYVLIHIYIYMYMHIDIVYTFDENLQYTYDR